MNIAVKDDPATVAAIGIFAYLSADIAHHAMGHGGACLLTGGTINLLSSVFVDCSLRGAVIDLAGPFANLTCGVIALLLSARAFAPASKLFWILAAAFNLFWFEMQMAFSAATRTDDWAWPIQQFGIADIWRYALIVAGLIAYRLTIQLIAKRFAPYATAKSRVQQIAFISWISAGLLALLTASFDHHPANAIWHYALPQSMLLSLGLLFIPGRIKHFLPSETGGTAITYSRYWTVMALLTAVMSIALLGPGINLMAL
ncbi:MAG: hypothetical protein ABUL58_07500 [Steroidobacter sp.]